MDGRIEGVESHQKFHMCNLSSAATLGMHACLRNPCGIFVTPIDWPSAASRLVRVELARADWTFADLAEGLKTIGVKETEASIKSKLHRGTFSAMFLMQCLVALGRESEEMKAVLRSTGKGDKP